MAKRGRPKGTKLSEETKERIAAARRGKKHSDETKEKISRSLKEFFLTEEGEEAKIKASELGKERMKGKSIRTLKKKEEL